MNPSATRERYKALFSFSAGLFFMVCAPAQAQSLSIDEVKWESGDHLLVGKGEAPRRSTIRVLNAGDGSLITTIESGRRSEWRLRQGMDRPPCRLRVEAGALSAERNVQEAGSDCDSGATEPPPPPPAGGTSINSTSTSLNSAMTPVTEQSLGDGNAYALFAANDLGMHCADLDYQIFSILPPFNVVHAQVVRKGADPQLMDDSNIEVVYSAASNANDPAQANSTAAERGEVIYKGNFWQTMPGDANPLWYEAYAPLYFGLLQPGDLSEDAGLPVPDSMKLSGTPEAYCLAGYLAGSEGPEGPRVKCDLSQATMPGHLNPYLANAPKTFGRFDREVNFFNGLLGGLGLGAIVPETNWFSAEGIPIMPVDDQGRTNPYPLMRVQAKDRTTGAILASTDVVLPVATEADCQGCHARTFDCEDVNQTYGYTLQCSEQALDRAHPEIVGYVPPVVAESGQAPGDTLEQRMLNAAKINILRLHDAKWGTTLDSTRRVVCASCHYSPALDLAQLGPTDSPATEQTQHISMSRAMHKHHGDLMAKSLAAALFPDMPAPNDPIRDEPVASHLDRFPLADAASTQTVTEYVLEQSCYSCHPGKRTQCLRGAMANGGVVCQDCHGDMATVGDDFTHRFPSTAGAMDTSKRIPWAVEPGCQSCHVGDATHQPGNTQGFIYAEDGIRLLRAYRSGDGSATPIRARDSRFAENQVTNSLGQPVDLLYRLSKGHGGLSCEGCHGSTHAIFPNPNADANDNVAATQIQGHSGTVIECNACHTGILPNRMDGPHGMHPVGAGSDWNEGHEDVAERDTTACKSCHGPDGAGTVLARTATERTWLCKDEKGSLCSREDQRITVSKGTVVSCTLCHENKINGD
ncbi:hypothetical protein [Nitrogeniibacter aestuarii]|uniref:hypothetical protein n=1 Tax=Nitrogeniibacter aestuarii TaxID=2815343 RepID=UPI001E374326|nr:hypothetical protein [Nitrogeniibacter aestuarii]